MFGFFAVYYIMETICLFSAKTRWERQGSAPDRWQTFIYCEKVIFF